MRIILILTLMIGCTFSQTQDTVSLNFFFKADEKFYASARSYVGKQKRIVYRHTYDKSNRSIGSTVDFLRTFISVTDLDKFKSLYVSECDNVPIPEFLKLKRRSSREEINLICKVTLTSGKTGKEIQLVIMDRSDFDGKQIFNEVFVLERFRSMYYINTCDYEELEELCKSIEDWSNESEIEDVFEEYLNYVRTVNGELHKIDSTVLKGADFEVKNSLLKPILEPINESFLLVSYEEPRHDSLFVNGNPKDPGEWGGPRVFVKESKDKLEYRPTKIYTYYNPDHKRHFALVFVETWYDDECRFTNRYFMEKGKSSWGFSTEDHRPKMYTLILKFKFDFFRGLDSKRLKEVFGECVVDEKYIDVDCAKRYEVDDKIVKEYEADFILDAAWYEENWLRPYSETD